MMTKITTFFFHNNTSNFVLIHEGKESIVPNTFNGHLQCVQSSFITTFPVIFLLFVKAIDTWVTTMPAGCFYFRSVYSLAEPSVFAC